IVLALLLLWGFYRGFINGLFLDLASLIALSAGIYGAIHCSYSAGAHLAANMERDARCITLVSFVGTFIMIVVIVHVAGKLLAKLRVPFLEPLKLQLFWEPCCYFSIVSTTPLMQWTKPPRKSPCSMGPLRILASLPLVRY